MGRDKLNKALDIVRFSLEKEVPSLPTLIELKVSASLKLPENSSSGIFLK